MKLLSLLALGMCLLTACTQTMTMVHTEGAASDVVDDTSSPSAEVSPTLNIPVSAMP